jgi:hypothetical protein
VFCNCTSAPPGTALHCNTYRIHYTLRASLGMYELRHSQDTCEPLLCMVDICLLCLISIELYYGYTGVYIRKGLNTKQRGCIHLSKPVHTCRTIPFGKNVIHKPTIIRTAYAYTWIECTYTACMGLPVPFAGIWDAPFHVGNEHPHRVRYNK